VTIVYNLGDCRGPRGSARRVVSTIRQFRHARVYGGGEPNVVFACSLARRSYSKREVLFDRVARSSQGKGVWDRSSLRQVNLARPNRTLPFTIALEFADGVSPLVHCLARGQHATVACIAGIAARTEAEDA